MKIVAILPSFLPLEKLKVAVAQIMPELEILDSTDFKEHDAEVLVITTFTEVNRTLIDKFPKLRFIQVSSTGYDNVDLETAKNRGIMVSNIPVANKEPVAEHVIMLALILLRDFVYLNEQIKHKNWPVLAGARELKGKIFGIIGMGAIGIKLVERLIPFELGIVYYDVNRLPSEKEEFYGIRYANLRELLSIADIISLHVPLTDQTKNMISEEEFSYVKEGAIIINTSRAEVIDEKTLIKAIKEKNVKVGIDVYSSEPPDFSSELFSLDNVIFSPHIAGATQESQERFVTETISNVMRYVQGLDPMYRVV